MSKKVLYIANVNLEGPFLPGVISKIKGQLKSMKDSGFDVTALYPGNNQQVILKNSHSQKEFSGSRQVNISGSFFSKLIDHIKVSLLGSLNFSYCCNEIIGKNYDAVYLRFYLPGRDLIRFLRRVKKRSPTTMILLEYPTLNVADEMKKRSLVSRVSYYLNKSYIKKLNENADYIITLTKDKTLFGKPTIHMPNGISLDEISPVATPPFTDRFVMIGVTSDCAFYHGFDKILKGIADYKKQNSTVEVLFRIVSNPLSSYVDHLKNMAKELRIDDQVVFEVTMTRAELAEEYARIHVGIGTLALHRIGLMDNYSLKHREYAAFGIPFIMSKGDDQFEDSEFVFTVERNDEPIHIGRLIEFYLTLRNKYIDYPARFRESAKNKISWSHNMQAVYNVIRNR